MDLAGLVEFPTRSVIFDLRDAIAPAEVEKERYHPK